MKKFVFEFKDGKRVKIDFSDKDAKKVDDAAVFIRQDTRLNPSVRVFVYLYDKQVFKEVDAVYLNPPELDIE